MSEPTKPGLTVDITGADLHRHVDDAWRSLVAANEVEHPFPQTLLRGNVLVKLSEDDGRVTLVPYNSKSLRYELSRTTSFVRQMHGRVTAAKPPTDVADLLLNLSPQLLLGATRVNRVTDVPVVGPDGAVLTSPGYHSGSKTYFVPAPDFRELAELGWDPDDHEDEYLRGEDVMRAVDLLVHELLADFPIHHDPSSVAHALCLILEPFVRELIGPSPTPMYGVIAAQPGCGKSLLAEVCLGVACGSVPVSTYTADETELRKELTAALLEGRPAIVYDNVRQPLNSAVLAAALTTNRWSARILGHSKMADVPVRNVWAFTANNPTISPELTRRIVLIDLDPGDEDPLARTDWKHQLPGWAIANRPELVSAALTLVANYLHGERSSWTDDEGNLLRYRASSAAFLGSYPAWSNVMGGILGAAGVDGFLGNVDRLREDADRETDENAQFLAYWSEGWPNPLSVDELAVGIEREGAIGKPVPLPMSLRGRGDLDVKLATWLRDHRKGVYGGYRVRKVDGRPNRWVAVRVGA